MKIFFLTVFIFVTVSFTTHQLSGQEASRTWISNPYDVNPFLRVSSGTLNSSESVITLDGHKKFLGLKKKDPKEWPHIFEEDLGSRFFIYGVRTNIFGFPMSYNEGWEGVCRSDGKGFGVGGGYTFCMDRISWDMGLHYAGATFSDFRITRNLSFFIVDFLDLGYNIVDSKIPICLNINFGGGVFHQSNYVGKKIDGTADPLEYLDEWDYPMRMGLDLKIGIIKYCMMKFSYHYYSKGSSTHGPNVIIVNPTDDREQNKLGSVLSFGLEFYYDPLK